MVRKDLKSATGIVAVAPAPVAGMAETDATSEDLAISANPTGSSGSLWLRAAGGASAPALDAEQEQQLDAIFDRIWPADAERGVPGAVRARASRFVSLLLALDASVYEEIPDWRQKYPAWLRALDQYSREKLGAPLTQLDAVRRDALVAGLEAASLVGMDATIDQKKMFQTLRRHCLQGCVSDPRWGGNAARLLWRWMGYLQAAEEL
jgi:hypothetical protein